MGAVSTGVRRKWPSASVIVDAMTCLQSASHVFDVSAVDWLAMVGFYRDDSSQRLRFYGAHLDRLVSLREAGRGGKRQRRKGEQPSAEHQSSAVKMFLDR